MSADCIFCKIVAGAIPSHPVYQDPQVFAFLDIRPLALGHTLVVPLVHAARFEDLSTDQAAALWRTVHHLVPIVQRATGAPATTLAINNGREAGQEVPHVHVHVVPRTQADAAGPIHALFRNRPAPTSEQLSQLAQTIRRATTPARSA